MATAEIYCSKCHRKQEFRNAVEYTMKGGYPGVRANCAVCGGGVGRRGPLPK